MSSMMLFSAILISLLIGYLIADWQGSKFVLRKWRIFAARHFKQQFRAEDSRYYGVLTKLLNDQPDEALDQFISKMEVNADTLEMHLALGALLRRRGEFDRAVRVHQNLLTRPGLPTQSIHKVQLELATDYWRSGLLDRAEALLKELMHVAGVNKGTRWQAAAHLVEIYQDLGEWLEAIDVADQLTAKKFSNEADFWRSLQAQFCCELAEQALGKKDEDFAVQKIRKALAYDPNCVRAHLLRANFALAHQDTSSALISLDYIAKFDPSYLSETLSIFDACLDTEQKLSRYRDFQRQCPSLAVLLAILDVYIRQGEYALGKSFLDEELERVPALSEEATMLKFAVTSEYGLEERIDTLADHLNRKQSYACTQCGAEHERMLWLCPSCQSWSTVRRTPQ